VSYEVLRHFLFRILHTDFREFPFRDCPKRGTSNAPKVDWDAMRKSKWVEKSLLDDL
jgi:hypothetical protein